MRGVVSLGLRIEFLGSGPPKVKVLDAQSSHDVTYAAALLESAVEKVATRFPDDNIVPSINYTRFQKRGAPCDRVVLASRQYGTALAIFLPPWVADRVTGFKKIRYTALPKLQGFFVPEDAVYSFLDLYVLSESE